MRKSGSYHRKRTLKGRTAIEQTVSLWLYVPVVVSLLVGLTLSLAAFTAVRQDESTEMEKTFNIAAVERIFAIKREMKPHLEFLDYITAFFNGSERITREEFRLFVDFGMKNLESFQMVGWAPQVLADEREEFEAQAPRPNFRIYYIPEPNRVESVPEKSAYYPIWYIEPEYENRLGYLGYDLGSRSTATLRLLNHARDHNLVVASNWVRLALEPEPTFGVNFYQPIYNVPGKALETVEQRKENFRGFIFGTYRIQDIIDAALSIFDSQDIYIPHIYAPHNIDITISNYSEYLGTLVTYDNQSRDFHSEPAPSDMSQVEAIDEMLVHSSNPPQELAVPGDLSYEYTMNFSGRQWKITCQASAEFVAQNRTWHPWGVLILGLLVTTLVTAYCIGNIGYTARTERLVRQRTVELKRANEELEAGIFERKRAKEAVEKLNRDLEEKNRELETLIYATSHDLRSPLLNIKGFSQELTDACDTLRSCLAPTGAAAAPDAPQTALLEHAIPEAVQYIQAGVSKMDKLLSGILRLSRLGKTALTIEPLDMNHMLSQIVKSMEYQIKETGAEVALQDLPHCLGDENQINQLFSNLLDNALKYKDNERKSLIEITGTLDANGRAVYCVKDNGIGIKAEQQELIFDMFQRLEPDELFGEGLGLTIARRIITRHNGRIWVESKYTEGSEFWIMLPGIETDNKPVESNQSEVEVAQEPEESG